MSTFMPFTNIFTNKPILLNIGAITALEPIEATPTYTLDHTKVYMTEQVFEVKEPIQAFFQQPPQQEPPDSGKAEVSTEGVPI